MDAHQPLFGKLSRILAVASIMTGLALSSAVSAAILTSNDGFISYDDTLTSVTSFERVGDQINTEFGTDRHRPHQPDRHDHYAKRDHHQYWLVSLARMGRRALWAA
jgi:hypothetical protein